MKIDFAAFGSTPSAAPGRAAPRKARAATTLVVFAGADLGFGAVTADTLGAAGVGLVKRAAGVAQFKGRAMTALDILAPGEVDAERLLVIGTGQGGKPAASGPAPLDFAALGGFLMGKLGSQAHATVVLDLPVAPKDPAAAAADVALGLKLRHYRFDRYKTRKRDDAPEEGSLEITLAVADLAAASAPPRRPTPWRRGS
jgi:leucyl aminopeptidase